MAKRLYSTIDKTTAARKARALAEKKAGVLKIPAAPRAKPPRAKSPGEKAPRAAGKQKAPPLSAIEKKYRAFAIEAARVADERRGADIRVLDLRPVADYTDFVVLASANSKTHARGIGRDIEKALREAGAPNPAKSLDDNTWIVQDYGDLVVHVLEETARGFYQLEKLWKEAPAVVWRARKKVDS